MRELLQLWRERARCWREVLAGQPTGGAFSCRKENRTEGKCAPCAAGGLQLWAGAEGLRGASEEGARDEALQNGAGGGGVMHQERGLCRARLTWPHLRESRREEQNLGHDNDHSFSLR